MLATLASAMIGLAMFGSTVYLSQYFQLSRGMSPTEAGLMSIAMVGGLLLSSIVIGRVITATGVWKRYLVGGSALVVVGFSLLGTIDHTTNLVQVGAFMALVGLGIGATMQNLVLAVQNNTRQADMGAASATVSFFRSMGGAVGVSALGAVLAHQVRDSLEAGLAKLGVSGAGTGGGSIPDVASLPAPVRNLYETAFGEATGHIFLISVPFALVAFVCILFIREVPLRTTLDVEEDRPARSPRSRPLPRRRERRGRRGARASAGTRGRTPYTGWSRRSACCCAGCAVPWASGPGWCTPTCTRRRTSCWPTSTSTARCARPPLVEAMDLDKGAMSRGVQHLIDLGLVDRTPDPADGRATLLSVSAEGRTRLADMAVHRRKRLDERLSGWSDDELDRLRLRAGPLQRHPRADARACRIPQVPGETGASRALQHAGSANIARGARRTSPRPVVPSEPTR